MNTEYYIWENYEYWTAYDGKQWIGWHKLMFHGKDKEILNEKLEELKLLAAPIIKSTKEKIQFKIESEDWNFD